jgi:uncharacterized protein (DUF1778 family)
MSVLKPRNRLVNFRLTDEEVTILHQACREQGARSISDFARAAVMTQVEGAPPGATDAQLIRLEAAVQSLDARVAELNSLLQSPQMPAVELPPSQVPQ